MSEAQYSYVKDGSKVYTAAPPPAGVAHDKLVNGKVVERNVVQNATLGRVITQEGGGAGAASAADAKKQAADAAKQQSKSELARLTAVHQAAKDELAAAAAENLEAVGELAEQIGKLNPSLNLQDKTQDAIDYSLAGGGVAAGYLVAGPIGFVVGTAIAVAGWVNGAMRPDDDGPDPENAMDEAAQQVQDHAGHFADGVSIAGGASKDLFLNSGARGLGTLGNLSAGASVYGAAMSDPRSVDVQSWASWDSKGLIDFRNRLNEFHPNMAEKLAMKAKGLDFDKLRASAGKAASARKKLEKAQAKEQAASAAVIKASVASWIAPMK